LLKIHGRLFSVQISDVIKPLRRSMVGRGQDRFGSKARAVLAGGKDRQVYFSLRPDTDRGLWRELVDGGVGSQTRQVLKNLQAVVDASGASLKDVVKTTVYLTDLSTFSEMNAMYAEFFTEPYPARATVGVSALPKGAAVEIDAIVVAGDDV
jgi:reactive intermediate/imine deaminase